MSDHQSVELRILSQEGGIEAGLADMERCVGTMRRAFELYNRGRVLMGDPGEKMHGHVTTFPGGLADAEDLESGPDRRFSAMPAYVGGDIDRAGIKWYGSNITNPAERGLPRSIHTITLNDPVSGRPLLVMDGGAASAMRTGATAALGADAIQGDRATTATIIGPGVIGRTAALGLDRALDALETLRIHHPELWKAEAFEAELRDEVDAGIEPVDEPRAAVAGADVTVVAAAGSPPPAIDPSWLQDDSLVIPLGDLRTSLGGFDADRVFCDVRRNTLEFAEQVDWGITNAVAAAVDYDVGLAIERDDLRALHELVAGEDTAPTEGTAILYSPGLPMEDVAWASEVHRAAEADDIGETVTLFSEPYFSKPY